MAKQEGFWICHEVEPVTTNNTPNLHRFHHHQPHHHHHQQQQQQQFSQFAALDDGSFHPLSLDLALDPLFDSSPDTEHFGHARFPDDIEEHEVQDHDPQQLQEELVDRESSGQDDVIVMQAQTKEAIGRRESRRPSKYHSKSASFPFAPLTFPPFSRLLVIKL